MTFSTKVLLALSTTLVGVGIAYKISRRNQAREAKERRLARRREAEAQESEQVAL
jgi:hypothetical protein